MAAKSKQKKPSSNGIQSNQTANSAQIAPQDDESPLKLFGQAKDTINVLFQKIDVSVSRATKLLSDIHTDADVLKEGDTTKLSQLSKSIKTIRNVLSRNQMKVAFFGRTSNGKSTVINAILHDKVLPMGYGHTTGCFLQIQGNQQNEAFLEVQKNGQTFERQPIQSVSHIANALNSGSLEHSALVKIYWPISKCQLLKYDVVLVDSPGVDVEVNLDDWIDEHCHDADVFVLVSNAESTLNIAEKSFFHKVSVKLSKPNIFILNNRWDSIADDPDSIDQVRDQHIERAVQFLSDELKISTQQEARKKTFFVSARETLQARTHQSPQSVREGFQDRLREFDAFERNFEESLSKSAVQTKFKKHNDRGKDTLDELGGILRSAKNTVHKVTEDKSIELKEREQLCESLCKVFYSMEKKILQDIGEIKRKVQIRTDTEFENEIRRLSRVVDEFDLEFSPHPDKLKYYKEQLYAHVEETLSENLKPKIEKSITKSVEPFYELMLKNISPLLTKTKQQKVSQIVSQRSQLQDELFNKPIYKQFYKEFHEDLEFRFSYGLVSIIRRLQSRFSPVKPPAQYSSQQALAVDNDFLAIMERFMLSSPQSPTTVGSLAVGGLLVRSVGWKVIVITSVVYGALYAYEYLTWTNSTKERTFKSQYVRYATRGLHVCAPDISQEISDSIERKLISVFTDVKKEVDLEYEEQTSKITFLMKSLHKLRECSALTDELLSDNTSLMNELVNFATVFLTL